MKKKIDIHVAIKNLPDELITPEIYNAAISEGNIKLLNILPEHYLTEENINSILDKNNQHSYSWETFSLSAIPENCRTEKVCETAVAKSLENYLVVPQDKRSNEMLLKIMQSAEKYLHYLSMVPISSWDANAVYKGVSSIYQSGSNSNNRHHSNTALDKKEQMKLIQILLSYVPQEIKTKEFYVGLFQTSMTVEHIDFLTPIMYKKNDYYLEVARKDIKQIPIHKLDYDTIIAGLLSDKNHISNFFGDWRNKSAIQGPMFEFMDDEMAEIIIRRDTLKFRELPDKFHTKNKLILALDSIDSRNIGYICNKFDSTQFDDETCRAIIRKNSSDIPKFAPEIWTQDFADYCMANAKSYYWFEYMPNKFQTQEMVDIVLKQYLGRLAYVLPEFISYDIAVEAHRYNSSSYNEDYSYRKFVPTHYINDFQMETGLPNAFFGGERSYSLLREHRENYTYCRMGTCCIGYFIDKDGREESKRLIMTRRTPMQIKPTIVFSRTVDTFHKTWFEKLIADNDPQFTKPDPSKGLKGKQINPYIEVKIAETVDGVKIYAHSLLSETIRYTANTERGYAESISLEGIKQQLRKQEQVELAC